MGRSSHFGIHDNFPTNLSIKDVKICDFVTHGIRKRGGNNKYSTNKNRNERSLIDHGSNNNCSSTGW